MHHQYTLVPTRTTRGAALFSARTVGVTYKLILTAVRNSGG